MSDARCLRIFSLPRMIRFLFFFFNDPATTEISPLSLHDALPICSPQSNRIIHRPRERLRGPVHHGVARERSEEHTSELQSQSKLVCRLLLEKKRSKLRSAICRTRPTPSPASTASTPST